jgi:integrase
MRGTVYRRQRPDGSWSRWYAVIDLPKRPDGRRRQRTTSHNTKREAQAWLARTVQELSAGEHYDHTLTMATYLPAWLEGKQTLRPSTRLAYGTHLRLYLLPHLGHLRVGDVRAHHIEEMYRQIVVENKARERPVGTATLHRVHATLMSALNVAVRRGLLRRNPASTVELPTARPTRPKLWSLAQLVAFLDAITDDQLHPLYTLLALRGLRRGEALGLRWSDVDWQQRTINIRQQIVAVGTNVVVGPPKTHAGIRTIAISEDLARLLRDHKRRGGAERLHAGPGWTDSGLVFTRPDGTALPPAYVSRHFQRLAAAQGLPAIRLHDLRHLSATLGLASGESIKEVSARLGHSSIQITGDVYAQVAPEMAHASAERLAQHLRAAR